MAGHDHLNTILVERNERQDVFLRKKSKGVYKLLFQSSQGNGMKYRRLSF